MRVPPVSFAGNWVEWNRQCRPLPTWLGSALACSLPGAELACDIGDAVCLGLSWRAASAMQSLVVRPLALVAPFLQELMGSGDQVLALVLFGEMEWQDMRAMHDLGVSDGKGNPSWQDYRSVYSQMAACRAYRIHGVQILPKPAHFGYTTAICCQGGAFFLSDVQFGIHQVKILPRMSAWESFR